METLFELTFQDQTLNPQVGTFTDASQVTGTFTLEDGEYYLTNGDTKGFYAYKPIALQSGLTYDGKVIIEFDLKVVTASVNTHAIIGTYAGVDGNGVPTGAKITLQYNAGDIELVLGGGATETLIAAADVVVDQWYHFRFDCALAPTESTYEVKIDGVSVTTVTGATTDYELGIISVLGTDLHACDECGIKNITLVTETNLYVGRTALDQALTDTKGYIDNQVGACVPLAGSNAISGSLIPATDNSVNLGDSTYGFANFYTNKIYLKDSTIFKLVDDSFICLGGATAQANGANLTLNGKNRSTSTGEFKLEARTGTYTRQLIGKPDGTLSWNGYIIPSADDTYDLGSSTYNFRYANVKRIRQNDLSDYLFLVGAPSWNEGASISLFGKNNTASSGGFRLDAHNGTVFKRLEGFPDGTLSWDNKNVAMQEDVIPLAGSNAISGDLIPATDNSIDIGSSTKNIKTLYTKSITINGTQFLPSDYVLPAGSYIQFAGSQAPAGFLVCNGGAISRTTYSALFAVIGTTYGSGDGSTTFNLPNLTDRFLQGSTTSGTVKNAGLPNITGSCRPASPNGDHGFNGQGAFKDVATSAAANQPGNYTASGNKNLEFDASRSNSIYGNSTTVQPPALTCLICIKY